MKNLSEKGLLVNLKISQWTGRKYDKKVTQQIEKDHNARNAGQFNKILIAEDELKKIQSISKSLRTFLHENTLPWGDNGDRLLPATNYFEFINASREFKNKFEKAVTVFIGEYPALKEGAKHRLNGMFREGDYPTVAKMQTKFNIEISYMPISDTKDFRVEVGAEEVNKLRTLIESEINNRIMGTMKDIWMRIHETVGHMVEKLSDKDAKFKNSLVENIYDLIDVLPRLNFTNDRNINDTINTMKNLLVDPEALRTNTNLRDTKAKEAKAILDKVSDFLG